MRRLLVLELVLLISGCRHGRAPAPAPSCAAAAAHVHGLIAPHDPRATAIRDVVLARCVEDQWPDPVRTCIVGTRSLKDPQHCKAKLPIDQRARLDAALHEVGARAVPHGQPSACDRWGLLITKLDGCDALPRASRDALIQSFELQRRSLGQLEPAAAEEQCKSSIELINQIASGLCGW